MYSLALRDHSGTHWSISQNILPSFHTHSSQQHPYDFYMRLWVTYAPEIPSGTIFPSVNSCYWSRQLQPCILKAKKKKPVQKYWFKEYNQASRSEVLTRSRPNSAPQIYAAGKAGCDLGWWGGTKNWVKTKLDLQDLVLVSHKSARILVNDSLYISIRFETLIDKKWVKNTPTLPAISVHFHIPCFLQASALQLLVSRQSRMNLFRLLYLML